MAQLLTSSYRHRTQMEPPVTHKKPFGSFEDGLQQLAQITPPRQAGSGVYFDGNLVGEYIKYESGHMRTRCSSCDNVYKCKTTLVRHWRQRHGLDGGVVCPDCGRRFGQKSNLVDHAVACIAREKTNLKYSGDRNILSREHTQVARPDILTGNLRHPVEIPSDENTQAGRTVPGLDRPGDIKIAANESEYPGVVGPDILTGNLSHSVEIPSDENTQGGRIMPGLDYPGDIRIPANESENTQVAGPGLSSENLQTISGSPE